MDTRGPRAADDADPAPDRPAAGAHAVPDASAGVEPERPDQDDDSDTPWAAIGIVTAVLVTGAFATGWHFGRRWGRLMGW